MKKKSRVQIIIKNFTIYPIRNTKNYFLNETLMFILINNKSSKYWKKI